MSRLCKRCNQEKDLSDFYVKGSHNTYHYCKKCCSDQSLERQRAFKRLCVEYKGGCCEKCGYNRCYAVLEFHHLDPKQKDFAISQMRKFSIYELSQEIIKELDKCSLLCSNCHKEEHYLINNSQPRTIRANPTQHEPQKVQVCNCGKQIHRGSQMCKKCYLVKRRPQTIPVCQCGRSMAKESKVCRICHNTRPKDKKINWPPVSEILSMTNSLGFRATGRILGVSDNAIRKHLKYHASDKT